MFATLRLDISRTSWRMKVSDGSFFWIFHALSFLFLFNIGINKSSARLKIVIPGTRRREDKSEHKRFLSFDNLWYS